MELENPEIEAPELPEYEPSDFNQFTLLSYARANPVIWNRCIPIMNPDLFDPEFQSVIKMILDYTGKYKQMPSPMVVQAQTGVRLEVPEDAQQTGTVQSICEGMEEFVRVKATEEFLVRASNIVAKDRSRSTLAGLNKEMEKISKITINRNTGLEVFTDMARVLKQSEAMDAIPTGMPVLDMCLDGGTTMPSLNLVSASSGKGKSIWLANMAVNYALMGFNVLFVTLELEPATVFKRFAAMLTNTPMNKIYAEQEAVAFKLKTIKQDSGRIFVHKLPMVGTTMADVRALYNDLILEIGEEIFFVCIDYIDVMSPMRAGIRIDDLHGKDKAISEEMNDFAHEPGQEKIVWSASQMVKGAEADKESGMGSVAGGKDKVSTSDNLIILKQSKEDKEVERAWGFIKKARSSAGTDLVFPYHWNQDTQRMRDWPDPDLLFETNPILRRRFGKKEKSKIEKDPIGKEMGIESKTSGPPVSGQIKSGNDMQARILSKLGARPV